MHEQRVPGGARDTGVVLTFGRRQRKPRASSAVTTRRSPAWPGAMHPTTANGVLARMQASATSSQDIAPASSVANDSVATPPQHWPSRAASGNRTNHCAGGASVSSAS